jgi:hypothetical protein
MALGDFLKIIVIAICSYWNPLFIFPSHNIVSHILYIITCKGVNQPYFKSGTTVKEYPGYITIRP